MKSFIFVFLMSAALLSPVSARASANCHPIVGNWVNAATKNCHEEVPGASNGGGSDVSYSQRRKCEWEWNT